MAFGTLATFSQSVKTVVTSVSGWLNSLPFAVYNATPTVRTEAQAGPLQSDSNGNLLNSLATKIAGEDLTNDVLKTEYQYSMTVCTADTQVKASAGYVKSLSFSATTASLTGGMVTLYDSTTESGTIIWKGWLTAGLQPCEVSINRIMATGIYVGFDVTLANAAIHVQWR